MNKWEAIRTGFGEDYYAWTVREGKRSMCNTETLRRPEIGVVDWLTGKPEELQARMELIAAAVNVVREINPENPIRAAEKMLEAIEALKKIASWEFDIMGDCVAEARQIARRAFLDITDRESA